MALGCLEVRLRFAIFSRRMNLSPCSAQALQSSQPDMQETDGSSRAHPRSDVGTPGLPLAVLGLLGSLYLAQGLPYGCFTQALPALMRARGISLEEIGLTSLLALPWALKFLWAPLVDRVGSRRFGRRRTWIVPLQVLSVATLVVLSFVAEFLGGSFE